MRRPVPPRRPPRPALLGLACAALAACAPAEPPLVEFHGRTMGTVYTVKVATPPKRIDGATLQREVDELLVTINAAMSTHDPNSELSRFNRNTSTAWIDASPALVTVLGEALEISRLSGGAFDVTVGPLVNLWGFGPDPSRQQVPAARELAQARARVGYRHVHVRLQPPAVKKDRPDLYVDLSSIAKGYGVDRIAAHLESQGITRYLVEIGGEIRARGLNPAGAPWRIGIEKPLPQQRTVYQVIHVRDLAVASSGDYRSYFERDGQRYSHTIDPATGRPVTHRLAAVTVVHPSAMRADALATTLMVLGPEAGYRLATVQDLAAFFIIKSGDGFVDIATPGFLQYTDRK